MAGGSGPLSPKADGATSARRGQHRVLYGYMLQVTSSAVAGVAAIIARRFVSAPSKSERTLRIHDTLLEARRAADLRFHIWWTMFQGAKWGVDDDRRTRTAATSPGSKRCTASGCHSIVPQTNASQWCLCTASPAFSRPLFFHGCSRRLVMADVFHRESTKINLKLIFGM
jgi:hypothetical protein